jgi:hypothetical protein
MSTNDGASSCPECKLARLEHEQSNGRSAEPECKTDCDPTTWPSLFRLVAWLRSHATLP